MSLEELPGAEASTGVVLRPRLRATVVMAGEIDMVTAPAMRDRILAAADAAGVVVDFGQVTCIDSCGVDALERARILLAADGRGLMVRRAPPLLTLMLAMFGLSDMIEDPSTASVTSVADSGRMSFLAGTGLAVSRPAWRTTSGRSARA